MIYKKFTAFLLAIALIATTAGLISPTKVYASTTIMDCDDLADIADNLDGDYVLGGNIDCSGVADWEPLGTFTGKLDGAGYAIQDLTILGYVNGNAFISNLDAARIYNLSFTNATVQTNFVGGVLATTANNETRIVNVHVEGEIISNAVLSLTGGLIGVLNNSDMYHSSADMHISGYETLGGLVGVSENGSLISNSYAVGTVDGGGGNPSTVGGLVGNNNDSTITNSYARVDISATGDIAGGLVGINEDDGYIYRSYAAGIVGSIDPTDLGGLVGQESGATTDASFWDTEVSGQATSSGGTGKTTAEMKTQSTYTGWDFSTVWSHTAGQYPELREYDGTPAELSLVTPLAGKVISEDARFYFSAIGSGSQETIVSDCGGTSNVVAEALTLDGSPVGIGFEDLEVGQMYSCEVFVRNLTENESNHLTIGPFSVVSTYSRSGSTAGKIVPIVPIPNQQTPALNVDQQLAIPTLGVNSLLTRNLYYGLSGPDVKKLQQYLNTNGFKVAEAGPGSPGNETEFFGPLTRAAVIRFQKSKGISPAVGYVGLITRGVINGQ